MLADAVQVDWNMIINVLVAAAVGTTPGLAAYMRRLSHAVGTMIEKADSFEQRIVKLESDINSLKGSANRIEKNTCEK
jgi:hypothetical protein